MSMPERYQVTEYATTAFEYQGSTKTYARTHVPKLVVCNWLGMEQGEYLSIAPKGNDTLAIGPQTPPILGKVKLSGAENTRTQLTREAMQYLGVDPGDDVYFRKASEHEAEVLTK